MTVFELVAKLTLDKSEYENALDGAEKDAKNSKFGEALGKAGKVAGAALAATGAAAVAVGKAAIDAGSEYQTAFAQVQTIMDSTQMSTEDMSAAITALSSEMGIAATDIAGTVYNAISATGDTANAVELAAQASQLATAGFTDTGSALSVLTTAMNAYGLSADEAAGISDSLIAVQNLGVTTVSELSASMGKAIASASAYGVDLTNLESAYVSLTKGGINTAESTTYISSMLKELGDSGTDVAKTIKEKTGKSFDELMAAGESLGDVLGVLYESVDGDSTALMNLWSSAEAGKASNAIVSQGLDEFNNNLIAIGESAGATESAYGIMADTLEHKIEVLKTNGTNLLTELFEKLEPTLTALAEKAIEFVDNLDVEALLGSVSSLVDTFIKFAPVIAAVVVSMQAYSVASAIAGTISALTKATEGQTIAQALLNAVMNANPFVLIATLIAGVVTALVVLWNTNEDFRNKVIEIWGAIQEAFSAAIDFIVNLFTQTLPELFNKGVELITNIKDGIISVANTIGSWFYDNVIEPPLTAITEFVTTVFDKGAEIINKLKEGIKSIASSIGAWVEENITGPIGDEFDAFDIFTIGVNIVKGLWNGINSVKDWVIGKVSGFVSSIGSTIKDFFGIASPSKLMKEYGGYIGEGLGIGLTNSLGAVEKSVANEMGVLADELSLGGVNMGVQSISANNSMMGSIANAISGKAGNNNDMRFTFISTLDGREIARDIYDYTAEYGMLRGATL